MTSPRRTAIPSCWREAENPRWSTMRFSMWPSICRSLSWSEIYGETGKQARPVWRERFTIYWTRRPSRRCCSLRLSVPWRWFGRTFRWKISWRRWASAQSTISATRLKALRGSVRQTIGREFKRNTAFFRAEKIVQSAGSNQGVNHRIGTEKHGQSSRGR